MIFSHKSIFANGNAMFIVKSRVIERYPGGLPLSCAGQQ
jgi:hypothetical protein